MNRGQKTLVAVAALFFLPVLAAIYLNSQWSDWEPESTRNFGTLLKPAVELPAQIRSALDTDGHWALAHFTAACGDECDALQADLGRVREAMGRHQEKLEVKMVESDTWPASLPARDDAHWIYVVDPNGYLVLHYPRDEDLTSIRKDLDRLLKYSKVGDDA